MVIEKLLVCPECRKPLQKVNEHDQQFLGCQSCLSLSPVIGSFVLFNEMDIAGHHLRQKARAAQMKLTNTAGYEEYCTAKRQRKIMEVYAAFQPFNESSRTIYPFVDTLKKQLAPGDLIIDLWNRTGWFSLLLAGLFPEQQVVSIWEGDHGTLGYSGFGYWFSSSQHPKNLSLIFLSPEQTLPFDDNSAALIHGHDIAHRRRFPGFLNDLLRTCKPDGTILLPHVHLSNNEPDPYFQRGGEYRHGRDYQKFLDRQLVDDLRQVMILSEEDIFEQSCPVTLRDGSESQHYNGMIAIAPRHSLTRELNENWLQNPDGNWQVLTNPLLKVCPLSGTVIKNRQDLGEKLDNLLLRHPVYQRRLRSSDGLQLSTHHIKLLSLADSSFSLEEIAKALSQPLDVIKDEFIFLSQFELVTILPVPRIAIELQNAHNNQHKITHLSFLTSWPMLLADKESPVQFFVDGESLNARDLNLLVTGWRHYLNLRKDVQCLHLGCENSLTVPIVLACWLEGISVTQNHSPQANSLSIVPSSENPGQHEISMDDMSANFYWSIVEPFLETKPHPDPPAQPFMAKVDNQHWWEWLGPYTSIID